MIEGSKVEFYNDNVNRMYPEVQDLCVHQRVNVKYLQQIIKNC